MPGGEAGSDRRVSRFAFACVASAVLCGLLASLPSSSLRGRHPVMDYAVAHGWSPTSMVTGLVALCAFPILAVVLDWALTRIGPFRVSAPPAPASGSGSAGESADAAAADTSASPASVTAPLLRAMAASLVLGLEISLILGYRGVTNVALVAAVTTVGATAIGWLARRERFGERTGVEVASIATVVAAALGIAGLAAVNAQVGVVVDGHRRSIAWLPWWSVLGALAAFGAALYRRRGAATNRWLRWASDATIGAVGPVAVLLLTARLPGALGWFDLFHDGEALVPAEQVRSGDTPWRDVLFIHGLFQDVLRPLAGLRWIESTRWGAAAGEALWWTPLFWLCQYGLAAWLYRRRRWAIGLQILLLAAGARVAFGFFTIPAVRLSLLPLVLVAFGVAASSRRTWPGVVLGALAVISVAISPETLLALVAIGFVYLLFELDARRRDDLAGWSRLTGIVSGAGAAMVILVIALLATGALGGFLGWFDTFSGYIFTGSHPIDLTSRRLLVLVPLTLVTPVAMIVYGLIRYRVTGRLRTEDWVMLALAASTLAYAQKFVGRPDLGHIEQVAPLAAPLAVFLLVEAIDALRQALARRPRPLIPAPISLGLRSAAVIGVAGLVLLAAADQRSGAGRFAPSVSAASETRGLGFIESSDGIDGIPTDLVAGLRAAGAERGVFDFSNSPALFHFLLDFPSPTHFTNVNMAMKPESQDRLIEDLTKAPPAVVVWSGPDAWYGLSVADDIPTATRHHRVAAWILDRYTPYLKVHGYWLWVPKQARSSLPDPSSLPHDVDGVIENAAAPECFWGEAPAHLEERPWRSPGLTDTDAEATVVVLGRSPDAPTSSIGVSAASGRACSYAGEACRGDRVGSRDL